LAEKKEKLGQACSQSFCFALPHSRRECSLGLSILVFSQNIPVNLFYPVILFKNSFLA